MRRALYCPIYVDGHICGSKIATLQEKKFRPDYLDVKCDKCGHYLRYDTKTNTFYTRKKPYTQDSSGKNIY